MTDGMRALPERHTAPVRTLSGPCLQDALIAGIYESMAIQINIRDVPEKVRDELASRAALQGKSMQEFLRAELERLAARPSIDAWLQQVRRRKRATQTRISSKQILENRNADRR
jgi:plasmid stability protein